MKFLILALVICAAARIRGSPVHTEDEDEAWKEFKLEHGKLFLSKGKETARKQNFLDNRAEFLELQAEFEAGNLKFEPKLYAHADLSTEEFVARFGGADIPDLRNVERTDYPASRQALPASFSAVQKGWTGTAKNQGNCNSCWAFAAIACVEVGYAMKGQGGLVFSEQQMVDCAKKDCNPSQMDLALNYMAANGGALKDNLYPYTGVYAGSCKVAKGTYVIGSKIYPTADAATVKAALVAHGALMIAIDCGPWQKYGKGVFHLDKGAAPNHAVTLVGWGSENGDDYWLVRNSWGTGFGENGYIKLSTKKDGGYNFQYTIGVNV